MTLKKWKVLDKENVSPSKWFPIEKHKVRLPDGSVVDDYFVSPLGNVSMVLPITKNKEIYLVKQYKHGLGEIVIELPAGFQQKGKTLQQSAIAELEEEIGAVVLEENLYSLGKIANVPTKIMNITYGFLAQEVELTSDQKLEVTENIEILKIKANKVLEMVKNEEIWVTDSVVFITRAYFQFPKLFKE